MSNPGRNGGHPASPLYDNPRGNPVKNPPVGPVTVDPQSRPAPTPGITVVPGPRQVVHDGQPPFPPAPPARPADGVKELVAGVPLRPWPPTGEPR